MKKLILLLLITISALLAQDIVVFNNEYKVLDLGKKVKKLLVGNKEMINVSLLSTSNSRTTTLKIFGKKSGTTSILIKYKDGSIENYHVYVNENLGFIQKMINMIEPSLSLSKIGDASTVITGSFKDPHNKKRIFAVLQSAGLDMTKLMDLTETAKVNKMVRTKLYLVEINNQKAKDLGGITGMGFFSEYLNAAINPGAVNAATFSGWLLDNAGAFTTTKGKSVSGTLNFLQESGIGKILDDTVLMTTEDENASFRVGGDVYIPIGVTQNIGLAPTILLEEKKYGLTLALNSQFMEKDGFMHITVNIEDSQFDTNKDHDVQLGEFIVVPSFVNKTIATNVVVKSGQVIVLGGRLHTEDIESEEKVPFLGDIPLLGELFTHTVSAQKENDLLFFLVPEIIDANENIDDTGFYKEFKDSTVEFHKDAYTYKKSPDKNSSIEVVNKKIPLVVLNDEADDVMLIEVEESNEKQENLIQKDISQEIIVEVPAEEKVVQKQTKYAVRSEKVFLRSKPVDGKRVRVWTRGHSFTASEEKMIDGKVWLRVKENCLEKCVAENSELWLSKAIVKII
ncbi:pilus assembly protein N-terminal domain-containing protein [Sulfurimonas sp. SAG-AH-194-L11]|nr:pilus assembly protein N-terminal domain-containing protein [Sulfurimonas sp. SAG-AH-194-L11]MDF1876851.1 pilus assembly protein N-terminal domain-containing protein [Sulfurimonas sp. SAG-AH-194-L11]